MKQGNMENKEQSGMEFLSLCIFSVYDMALFCIAASRDVFWWILAMMFGGILVCWTMYLTGYRNHRVRTFVTVFIMQSVMVLYGTQVKNPYLAIPVMLAFAVFTGLYGIPELLYINQVGSVVYFLYHIFISGKMYFDSFETALLPVAQIANVQIAEYMVFFWARKREENRLRVQRVIAELKEAEHSKDNFLANVSHEIRTPINTVCGMSVLALKEEDTQKVKDELVLIQTAGKNLLSLVSDILDFSELQSGKVEVEEENYNIASTINDIFGMANALKGNKNIEFIINCDANLPCGMLGDEKKIRRVILNLVNNAIKFTNEGYVSLSISFRRESYGINLDVEVKDSGIGMSEQDQEKLFDGFSQVDGSSRRQVGGMGLGLAISRLLVQKMGGIMSMKSSEGKGTVIKFVIPQEVTDERPIASLRDREDLNFAVCVNMEQFRLESVRGEYMESITNMVRQTNVRCHMCRNVSELKRRTKREQFTHIIITVVEYEEDQAYFDELSRYTRLIAILDSWDEEKITNPAIAKVCKPLYVLPLVAVVNGSAWKNADGRQLHEQKFIAPETKILAVDDNEMNLKVIEGLLGQYQIQVDTAISGKAALEKMAGAAYDLILMDHMMPEMDGVETLHRIRTLMGTYYQKVPVIAISANAVAGSREMFLAEGFSDFVEKPIDISVLERKLRKYLPKEKMCLPENGAEETASGEKAADTQELVIGDLNVKKGIGYCGGEQKYLEILKRHAETGLDTLNHIEELYREKNWKEYTIAVHGTKSAMLAIGAVTLSDLARELEFAGKENRYDEIVLKHSRMVEEYKRVLELLRQYFSIEDTETPEEIAAEDVENCVELEPEKLKEYVQEFEEAAYDFDGEKLQEILAVLQNSQCGGTALRHSLDNAQRKVEESDYLSAAELLKKLEAHWIQEEKA